jgi:hypothetical protein
MNVLVNHFGTQPALHGSAGARRVRRSTSATCRPSSAAVKQMFDHSLKRPVTGRAHPEERAPYACDFDAERARATAWAVAAAPE